MNPSSLTSGYLKIFAQSSGIANSWLRTIGGGRNSILIQRQVRSIDDNASRSFLESWILFNNEELLKLNTITMGVRPAIYDISPSSQTTIACYNSLNLGKGDDPKNIIEIVSNDNNQQKSFRVDTSSYHGKFVGDTWFGGVSWSSDGRYVAYVAEVKDSIKKSTYFSSNEKTKPDQKFNNKYDYIEDWGEKYDGITKVSIFVFDILNRIVISVPNVDHNIWTVGQPSFMPNNNNNNDLWLCYTAWKNIPRKLGMIYCYQRPCNLFMTNLGPVVTQSSSFHQTNNKEIIHIPLTNKLKLARSARFHRDGHTMVFLGSINGFVSHNGCSELFRIDCIKLMNEINNISKDDSIVEFSPTIETIISQIYKPSTQSPHDSLPFGFPGLFIDQLPKNCFINANQLILNSVWGSSDSILKVSLQTNEIINMNNIISEKAKSKYNKLLKSTISYNILDNNDNLILFSYSAPNQPLQLGIIDINNNINNDVVLVDYSSLDDVSIISNEVTVTNETDLNQTNYDVNHPLSLHQTLDWQQFYHTSKTDNIIFESILLYPINKDGTNYEYPLIVVPHGGPHSCSTTAFSPSYAFIANQLKVSILHVNYRGSTGYGQDSIESLLGNIGKNDVEDMMIAIHSLFDKKNELPIKINQNKIFVVGGSHGGFLASHLIGQYPSFFSGACLRNPVTNIPAMASVTDIPDWCFFECFGSSNAIKYGFDEYSNEPYKPPNAEQLAIMSQCSPVRYIDQVTTPTLICLGQKDRRVPYSQGVEYYHLLKARGIPTRLMIFPEDVHAIDKPASEAEHWVAIAEWIQKYL
eukprot:gene10072-13535_t